MTGAPKAQMCLFSCTCVRSADTFAVYSNTSVQSSGGTDFVTVFDNISSNVVFIGSK